MRALGLAHHWQHRLDEGRVASVADIAKAESTDVTQVRRVMRLTLFGAGGYRTVVGGRPIHRAGAGDVAALAVELASTTMDAVTHKR